MCRSLFSLVLSISISLLSGFRNGKIVVGAHRLAERTTAVFEYTLHDIACTSILFNNKNEVIKNLAEYMKNEFSARVVCTIEHL